MGRDPPVPGWAVPMPHAALRDSSGVGCAPWPEDSGCSALVPRSTRPPSAYKDEAAPEPPKHLGPGARGVPGARQPLSGLSGMREVVQGWIQPVGSASADTNPAAGREVGAAAPIPALQCLWGLPAPPPEPAGGWGEAASRSTWGAHPGEVALRGRFASPHRGCSQRPPSSPRPSAYDTAGCGRRLRMRSGRAGRQEKAKICFRVNWKGCGAERAPTLVHGRRHSLEPRAATCNALGTTRLLPGHRSRCCPRDAGRGRQRHRGGQARSHAGQWMRTTAPKPGPAPTKAPAPTGVPRQAGGAGEELGPVPRADWSQRRTEGSRLGGAAPAVCYYLHCVLLLCVMS